MDNELNNQQTEQDEQTNAQSSGEDNGNPNNKPDENDKPISLTQKQIDDLINKAFARGARKGKREASKNQSAPTAQNNDADEQDDTAQKAATALQKANERLLSGTVKNLAADLGLTTKGAKAALKLADFADCIKNDDVDEESVKDILEDFIKEYPEFKSVKDDDTTEPKAWGMRQGGRQKMSGVEAAFFDRNPDLKK